MGSKQVNKGAKKAALSLEVVAVAAIILIVILIVVTIFKGGIDKILPTVGAVNDCEKTGGKCGKAGDCKAGTEIWGLGCEKKPDGTPYCCKVKQNV